MWFDHGHLFARSFQWFHVSHFCSLLLKLFGCFCTYLIFVVFRQENFGAATSVDLFDLLALQTLLIQVWNSYKFMFLQWELLLFLFSDSILFHFKNRQRFDNNNYIRHFHSIFPALLQDMLGLPTGHPADLS